jgi:putative ABC transport system permease protein
MRAPHYQPAFVLFPLFRLTAIWEAFRVATSSLRANKLRTLLTLMGIVVGVTAVIAVVTIIKGLDKTVAQTFSSQGSTVFTISKNPQIIKSREDFVKFNRRKDVTHDDAEAVRRPLHGLLARWYRGQRNRNGQVR